MGEDTAYVSDVTPGDPASVRPLAAITVRKLSVSPMHNNVYLLTDRGGHSVLIDAADEPASIRALVEQAGGRLDAIVTTHQHWDHVRALAEVARSSGARTYAGRDDADALPAPPDVRLEHGDRIDVGDIALGVVHLRGHTPGGVGLAYTDPGDGRVHFFSGDSLFPGGVGNTKLPGQDFAQLYADVTERIFDVYDDRTWIYPGHGDDTTLGNERPHLEEWRERGW